MSRNRIVVVISTLVLLSLSCSFSGLGAKPTATPEPPTATFTPAEPTATPTEAPTAVPEGLITSFDQVQGAVVQFESQGSFVDPQFGQLTNVAGRGSGFIIDPSGIAVTNNHVVTGAALVKVWVQGETKPRNARVLGVSECWDLAVVDIDGEGFPWLGWYEGKVDPGLEVYAAGFPLGDPEFTLTKGIVSKANASGTTSWADVPAVIEHDARIRGGNSGGPLVNADGQVVGVNYAGNDTYDLNYAILGNEARDIVEKLTTEDFESLGINGQAVTNEDGSLTGIWVSSVASGTPADKAGLQGGDIITKMENLVLATDGSMEDYCSIIRTHDITDVLSIEVLRFDTSEVLNGQLNGTPLEASFSFAQELAAETTIDEGTGEYTEYVLIQDDSGAIQVEIPTAWSDVNGSPWIIDGEVVGASIFAATDISAFDIYQEPGVYFGVSDDLAQQAGYIMVLDAYSKSFREDCTFEGRDPYEDSAFEGHYEVFSGCAGNDNALVVLSARPIQNKTAFLVTVIVNIMSDADLTALDRIWASFDVVGTLP